MSTWNPLNRIVHTLKHALDAAKNSSVFEQRGRARTADDTPGTRGPQSSRSPNPSPQTRGHRKLSIRLGANNTSTVADAHQSGAPKNGKTQDLEDAVDQQRPDSTEQLHLPFTFNDLVSFADRADMTITANHDPYIHAIVDDLAVAITVSQDNTWLLVKSEFPVPPPGLHNMEHIDTDPSSEEIDRQLHLLIDATNEWNSATMYPTAYVDRTGHQWVIRLDTTFFIAGGLTLSQFQSHIDTARFYTRGAISQLPTLIPPV